LERLIGASGIEAARIDIGEESKLYPTEFLADT